MADVIIIGGGTAGLSAAIYVQRAGRSALVFESNVCGGQIINTLDVENYPGIRHVSGVDFAMGLMEQAEGLGAEIAYEEVLSVRDEGREKVVVTTSGEHRCGAVILATGVVRRELGLPEEKQLTGRGVSYCATCDGAFYRGRSVAVNGGGNTALEDAEYLAGICENVYLIHRRDQYRADDAAVRRIQAKENIRPVLNSTVSGFEKAEDGKLSGVEVVNKFTGEKQVLPVSGLFIAIGQVPSNAAFKDLVELDPEGYIAAGEDCRTTTPGIFAAGDCRTKKVRQLTTAASDGAVAALSACGYLTEME